MACGPSARAAPTSSVSFRHVPPWAFVRSSTNVSILLSHHHWASTSLASISPRVLYSIGSTRRAGLRCLIIRLIIQTIRAATHCMLDGRIGRAGSAQPAHHPPSQHGKALTHALGVSRRRSRVQVWVVGATTVGWGGWPSDGGDAQASLRVLLQHVSRIRWRSALNSRCGVAVQNGVGMYRNGRSGST
jgi:hypothetical protein